MEQRILPRLKLTTMPPNFDFTKLRQNLIDNDDDETCIRLLKGLHERLWHELYPGMERFLKRLGVPDRCLTLCRKVIEDCPHCHAYKPVPRRPKFGAELAGHFGDCLVVDFFFIWGHSFLIMVDEATRFKVSALLPTKDAKTLMKTMLAHWFRYFGPPRTLRSDQEGGIRADDFGLACDRFSIHRSLAGSDDTGQHTSTGLAERHIQLVKLSSLRCEHQCRMQGLDIDKEDIVMECTMAQNFQLEYGGFTPAQAVMGHNPRGLYETGTSSVVAHEGSAATSPDYFEAHLRMRLNARVAIQQAIIEQRIADANNAKPMQLDLSKLTPMETQVDL